MSAPSPLLLGRFEDWEEFCDYMAVYGMHLLFGFLLSAVTIYRREMSCNRVFHEEDEGKSQSDGKMDRTSSMSSTDNSMVSDAVEEETDELLDSAGMYCSGQPIRQLASLWMESFPYDNEEGEEQTFPSKLLQEHVTASDLLDRAGNFCSGEPIIAAVALFLYQQGKKIVPTKPAEKSYDPFTNQLPPDVHVQITSFLHPRDVASLSCVSRSYLSVINEGTTSQAIWRTLWERDYAWVVERWSVGREALERSALKGPIVVDKEFYFRFGLSYLNFVLAGRNTTADCMVGLHCHIYDITSFLESHPGSPDTLMVHAGKDSTRFFEDMGHSLVARRLAKKLCVLVDLSQLNHDGWGLRPTEATELQDGCVSAGSNGWPPRYEGAGDNLLQGRKQRSSGGTLKKVQTAMEAESTFLQRHLELCFANDPSIVGAVNPYYDPFLRKWRFWFTDTNLNSVFGSV